MMADVNNNPAEQSVRRTDGCRLCPRACGVLRASGEVGYCGGGGSLRIARAAIHRWEEPCIAGAGGAGAVFFSGCNLGCVYCQNFDVSHRCLGRDISEEEFTAILFDLKEKGAECIDLVTPTPYADVLLRVLSGVKDALGLPIVYNCGGYESVETVRMLSSVVDVWLPDFKYISPELSLAYSAAKDYGEVATAALRAMYEAAGKVRFDENGKLVRGVLVRHLVLPGARHDSVSVLHRIADTVPVFDVRLSLLNQYTPEFANACPHTVLHRRVTSFEYDSVADVAEALGFDGYFQERASSDACYTPAFYGEYGQNR